MELKFEKNMSCRLASRGKWGNLAAAWMGLSFFLRMVWYFGLMNLGDLGGGEIALRVVIPLLISVGFILMLKIKAFGLPMAAGIGAVVYAVSYFFCETMTFGGVLSGILLLATAGLILAAVLGYVPERKWLIWAALATAAFRILFVDLLGYILPLSEIKPFAYIPMASNGCGLIAACYLCPSLRLRKD